MLIQQQFLLQAIFLLLLLMVKINALGHVAGEIVEYIVTPFSKVAGQALRDMALPYDVGMTLVVHRDDIIIPRGGTSLEPGDHVFISMRSRFKPLLACFFDSCSVVPPLTAGMQLDFHTDCTVEQLHWFFGISEPVVSGQVPVGPLLTEDKRKTRIRLGPFDITPGDQPDKVTLYLH